MATLLKADEINNIHREYFEIMEISDEQKEERIELAELLDDVFFYLFIYIDAVETIGNVVAEELYEIAERRYQQAVSDYGIDLSKYPNVDNYTKKISRDIVDSTLRNTKNESDSINMPNGTNLVRYDDDVRRNSDVYRDSDRKLRKSNGLEGRRTQESNETTTRIQQRAIEVAQNEANTVFNYVEYDNAVNRGYTQKTWITEGDNKVRNSHADIDMLKIPIDEAFYVGDSRMMFPKDYTTFGANPREIVGCRCTVRYS